MVYTSPKEYDRQVVGFSGNRFKPFATRIERGIEAELFVQ